MFSYPRPPKPEVIELSTKRGYVSDSSDDDLAVRFIPKRSINETGELIRHMNLMSITKPATLKKSESTDTIFSADDCLVDLRADGDSEYEQSDTERTPATHILNQQRTLKRYKAVVPRLVNERGQALVLTTLNTNLNAKWKAHSYIAYAYKYNINKCRWVKKGPVATHLEHTANGDAKLSAHYLYGMNSTAFNMKFYTTFLKQFNDSNYTITFSSSGKNARTVSQSTYHPCNLSGMVVGERLYEGNYMRIETLLSNVGEEGASIWQLRLKGAEYAAFKQDFLTTLKNYVLFGAKVRYDGLLLGSNHLNPTKGKYITLCAPKTLLDNPLLMQEMAINGFTLVPRDTTYSTRSDLQDEHKLTNADFVGKSSDTIVQCTSCKLTLPATIITDIHLYHAMSGTACEFLAFHSDPANADHTFYNSIW